MNKVNHKGRAPTTGNYLTRDDLVYTVLKCMNNTDMGLEMIGKRCGVSKRTVQRILKDQEVSNG